MLMFRYRPKLVARFARVILSQLTVAAALGIAASSHAADPAGAVFLRVGVGARNAGMGDADLVSSRDPSVLYWNPAGLSNLAQREILLLHNNWLADVRQEYVGGAFPLSTGGFGFGANGLYVGNIPRYVDDVPQAEPQGDFGYYALALQGGYAFPIGDGLDLGFSVKAIREQVDIEGAWTAAVDGGLLYEISPQLKAAFVVANLGPPISLGGVDGELPLEARTGVGYAHEFGIVHTEVHGLFRATRALNPRAHFGIEAGAHRVFLRAGLKLGYDTEDLSFGLGCEIGRISVDYAFVPFTEDLLGEAHRISLAFQP
jgi:hypothetical protein